MNSSSTNFNLEIPLHLRYFTSPLNIDSKGFILSQINPPEVFLGLYDGWNPGIFIEFGGFPVGSPLTIQHSNLVDRLIQSHQTSNYHQSNILYSSCSCIIYSLTNLLQYNQFYSTIQYHFPSCFSSILFLDNDNSLVCSHHLTLSMSYPSNLSSMLIIITTCLIISISTCLLGYLLINRKKTFDEVKYHSRGRIN